ncbi:hypothetical protein [Pseudomonas viridiflava]|uniref:hypothetical protein n=1 Tax=Pseudomonas viridiflava TaxID=33069 RepID=UPI000F0167AC|nr:hypothetical protein [Pseudomonas viridiflava]
MGYFMFDKRRLHVFDVALSRSKHRTVGGGLPAMNDDAIFLKYRVDCIAGKPPPTKRVPSVVYSLFDKSRLPQSGVRCETTLFQKNAFFQLP